jgi:Xaa-Pro aminopeptidase
MGEAVAEMLGTPSVARCGIQAEVMTVAERDALAKKVGKQKLVSTTQLITRLRVVKDALEISLLRRAIKIQEEALRAVLATVEAGQSEAEVAARLDAEMKTRGAGRTGFETIVAARANGAMPHYRPGATKLAAQQAMLIDWGAVYRGYHGDMTRTFALGKWPKKLAEIYPIVLEAHEAAAAALAPGKSTTEIDKIAREIITKAGFGEAFGHGLGHGVGLHAHEEPRLSHMLAGTRLEAGQVVTIEPGIYLPGVGGVRIEDVYVVTGEGSKNLCSLPRTMEWGTLG